MLNNKYKITDKEFLLINDRCNNLKYHENKCEILEVFAKYNYYMTEEIFIDFCINNQFYKGDIEKYKKFTIYKDDDDKFNIIKNKITEILEVINYNIDNINKFIDNNTMTMELIYRYGSSLTRLMIDKFNKQNNTENNKTVTKKVIKRVVKKVIKKE